MIFLMIGNVMRLIIVLWLFVIFVFARNGSNVSGVSFKSFGDDFLSVGVKEDVKVKIM